MGTEQLIQNTLAISASVFCILSFELRWVLNFQNWMKFEAWVKFAASRTRCTVSQNLGPTTMKFASCESFSPRR